jgi:hypothetical protein
VLLLRRLRGILGTAVVWAIVWGALGAVFLAAQSLWEHLEHDPYRTPSYGQLLARGFLIFSIWGAVSGAVFALALALAERKRSVSDLSMRRVATWGALGGVTLPLIGIVVMPYIGPSTWMFVAQILGATGLLGAGCAAGTLALVRRGEASAAADV